MVCEVIAPSLIPVKSGERVKTDRRDARKLAKYLSAGLLTEVHPPSEQEESARDLTRCRRALKGDLMRARHRLSKLLLRRGIHYTAGKRGWTAMYTKWLKGLGFENRVDQVVFDQYLLAVEQLVDRLQHIDTELKKLSESPPSVRRWAGYDASAASTRWRR
jgi:transposase